MRRTRWSIAAATLFAALWLAAPSGAYVSSTWYEDASGYEEAVRQQKVMHAPMFVYFRADWCPHCRAFDQLLEEPTVRSRLGSIIKVRINPEHGRAERALFEERFGTKGYPALYLVDVDGTSRRRLSHGGPAERFVAQIPDSR